jgi:hypothetical protein
MRLDIRAELMRYLIAFLFLAVVSFKLPNPPQSVDMIWLVLAVFCAGAFIIDA